MIDNDLTKETIRVIKEHRQNALDGNINCIPFCIPELRYIYPGTMKGSIVGITGETKAAKSQWQTFSMIINPILYAYEHPDQLHIHYIYFSLEETKHELMLRFISYLLFVKYNIRISPIDIDSANSKMPLPENILNIIESKPMQDLLNFFQSHIEFYDDVYHTITMDNIVNDYAESHGTKIYSETDTFRDDNGGVAKKLIGYTPDDPSEYVIIVCDHVGLLTPNKLQQKLQEAIAHWSKCQVKYKNIYKYITAFAQQQVDSAHNGNDAIKLNNILAGKDGLKDNKQTGNDSTQLFGITDVAKYLGKATTIWDDYSKLFPNNFRVVELLLNRKGTGKLQFPVFFDGMTCYFEMLPPIGDERMTRFINLAKRIADEDNAKREKMEKLQADEIKKRLSTINVTISKHNIAKSKLFTNFVKLFK